MLSVKILFRFLDRKVFAKFLIDRECRDKRVETLKSAQSAVAVLDILLNLLLSPTHSDIAPQPFLLTTS